MSNGAGLVSRTFSDRTLTQSLALLAFAFLLPLLAHAYVGFFNRYTADDYCLAVEAQNRGLLGSAWYWYPRLGRIVGVHVHECRGEPVAPDIGTVLAGIWTGSVARHVDMAHRAIEARPAGSATSACVSRLGGADHRSHARRSPLNGGTGGVLADRRRSIPGASDRLRGVHRRRPPHYAPYGGPRRRVARPRGARRSRLPRQRVRRNTHGGAGCGLRLGRCRQRGPYPTARRRLVLPVILTGLGGTLLGALVVALSPGIAVRQGNFEPPPDVVGLAIATLRYTATYVKELVARAPGAVIVTAIVPALLARCQVAKSEESVVRDGSRGAKLTRWLVVIPIGAGLVIAASFAPAAWALSFFPPERTLLVPQFALSSALVAWSYILGRWPRSAVPAITRLPRWALVAAGIASVQPILASLETLERRFEQVLLPLNVNYSCRFGRLLVRRRTVQKTKRRERPLGDVHGVR